MDVSFRLGRRANGKDAGELLIRSQAMTPALSTPAVLRYSKSPVPGDIEVPPDPVTGWIRQVKTPQLLADVVTILSDEYEIRFYDPDGWGDGNQDVNGLYVPTGRPFVRWNVKNVSSVLTITKYIYNTDYDRWDCKTKYEYQFTYVSGKPTWKLKFGACTGEPLRTEERSSVYGTYEGHTQRTTTYKVYEGTTQVWQREDVYVDYGWGFVPVSFAAGSANQAKARRSYWTTEDPEHPGRYRKLKAWTDVDGSWSMFDYDPDGRKTLIVSSYRDEDMPTSDPTDSDGHAIVNDYTPIAGQGDDGTVKPKKPRTVTEKIKGVPVSKTFYVYYLDGGQIVEREERCIDPTENGSYGATGNLCTVRRYINEDSPERPASVVYPDGRMVKYTYATGLYQANTTDPDELGKFPATSGCQAVATTIEYGKESTSGTLELVADKSTKEVIIHDKAGNELQREVYACLTTGGDQLFEYQTQVFDSQGRLTDRYGSDNTHLSWTPVDCCNPATFTDATGIRTVYQYDDIGRLTSETKTFVEESSDSDGSYDPQPEVKTEYFYEVENDNYQIRTLVSAIEGQKTLTLRSETVYDDAGRVIKQIGQDRLTTSYAYSYVTDPTSGQVTEHTVTKTLPSPAADPITEISRYWRDGSLRSLTGTGVVHQYVDRGLDGSNRRYTKAYTGPSLGSSLMWQQTTQDTFGRTYQESRSGYNNSILTTTYSYNSDGQLERVESPGQADTLYSYDELGSVKLVCQDVNGNDAIDLASADRITGTEIKYGSDGTYVWRKTIDTVYGYTDDAQTTPSPTPIPVSQQWVVRNLRGIASDDTIELTKSLDVDLNVVLTTTTVDRDDRLVKRKTVYMDNGTDPYELSVSRNAVYQLSKSKSGLATTYSHDALGRQKRVTDPRGNYTDTEYYDGDKTTLRNKGKVLYTEDAAGNRTTYAYDSDTGQVASITTADGADEEGVQYFSYNPRGQLERTWGDTPYPVEYGYDDFGRQTSMKTYRGGTADETTWFFDPYSGLLTEKRYADHTQQNPRNIEYTYENDGRLKQRFWSRPNGANRLETEYLYGTTTGSTISDLTKIDYKDTTKDVEFTFNRLGMHKTVDDAVGTRTFAYDKDKLRLASELIEAGANGLYSRTITRLYEQGTDTLPGRYRGFRIGTSEPYEYETTYAYDDSGRIAQVFGNGLDATNGVTYSRLANSELIENVDYGNQVQTQRVPQQHLDLPASVENKVNSTTVSKYQYGVDTLGRRDSVVMTGTAFSGGSGDHHWDFGYNDRSELTGGERWTGAVLGQGTLFALKGDFDYGYDPIGNRQTGTTYADMDTTRYSTTYTTNTVNQYTVTSDPTESFSYDFDGNLSQDVGFDYAWDGENRLKTATPRNPDNGYEKVAFVYDYMGRRVRKAVYVYNSGWPAEESPNKVEHFVYDDWNVVLVLNGLDGEDPGTEPDNTLVRRCTWGLDLSGTIIGAGGIGGLLAVEETQGAFQGAYWFFYDGNGNVGQVVKASDQSVAARYEYDPYGNVIGPDDDQLNDPGYGDWRDDAGAYALVNPFRFSTKWFDDETGLGYWGYRYYSPRLGRWISRDPIGEGGGLNLCVFVKNEPNNYMDALGFQAMPPGNCGFFERGCRPIPPVRPGPGPTPPPGPGPTPPPGPGPTPPPGGCVPGTTVTGSFAVPGMGFTNCTDLPQTRTVTAKGTFQLDLPGVKTGVEYSVSQQITAPPHSMLWGEYSYSCTCQSTSSLSVVWVCGMVTKYGPPICLPIPVRVTRNSWVCSLNTFTLRQTGCGCSATQPAHPEISCSCRE